LLAVAAGIAGAQLPGRAQAMVGGAPTAPGEFGRSVVMIVGSSACTATAIGRDVLLTAAHCVQPGGDYGLLGSEPGQPPILKAIARIERHPQFDIKRLLNHLATADVALIKLRREFLRRSLLAAAKPLPSAIRLWPPAMVWPCAATAAPAAPRAPPPWSSPVSPGRCRSDYLIRRAKD
jgi:Trypsin